MIHVRTEDCTHVAFPFVHAMQRVPLTHTHAHTLKHTIQTPKNPPKKYQSHTHARPRPHGRKLGNVVLCTQEGEPEVALKLQKIWWRTILLLRLRTT